MNKLSIFFIFLYVIHVFFSKALFEFDGHTGTDALDRMLKLIKQ